MRKILGFLAMAGLLVIAAPAPKAEAAVMAPGVAATVQGAGEGVTTEVRYRRYRYVRRYYAPRRYYRPRVYAPYIYVPRRHYW